MLGMVLPGVRHVRTPLVTGALYLFVLWMLLGPERLTFRLDDGPAAERRIAAAADLVGRSGVLATLALIALLVGSLVVIEKWPFGPGQRLDWLFNTAVAPRDWEVERWIETRVGGLNMVTFGDVINSRTIDPDFKARLEDAWYHVDYDDRRRGDRLDHQTMDEFFDQPVDGWLLRLVVGETVLAEFDMLTARLQIERETLFNEVDRQRSEAELRYSIAPPLLILSVIFSFQWHWAAVFAALVPTLLVWQGHRAELSARAKVSEALRFGIIKSPTLERLEEIQRGETSGP